MDVAAISKHIQEYRRKTGLSHEDLAEKIGACEEDIMKWERGILPDVGSLIKLADAFDTTLDKLCEEVPDSDGTESDVFQKMSEYILGEADGEERGKNAVFRGFLNCILTIDSVVFLDTDPDWDTVRTEKDVIEHLNHKYPFSMADKNDLFAMLDKSEDSPFFLYMPQANGRGDKLTETPDDYCNMFTAFSNPDFLRAVFCLEKGTFAEEFGWGKFTKEQFAEALGFDDARAEDIIMRLQSYFGIKKDDESGVYTYYSSPYFLIMLQAMYYFLHHPCAFRNCANHRTEPRL